MEIYESIKLFKVSNNVVKNITKELKKENFQIKHPFKKEDVEDFHKSSISFSFFKDLFSIGNLQILWKQYKLDNEILNLREREKREKEPSIMDKFERFSKLSFKGDIESVLRNLQHNNYQINHELKSKLDCKVSHYLDDALKTDFSKYNDVSCFSLLKDLYRYFSDDKFILEGEQDCYIPFITINEHEIVPEFICFDCYDYDEPDYDYLSDSYKDEKI